MLDKLQLEFHRHLTDYHPDVLFSLEQDNKVTTYIKNKTAGISELLQTLQEQQLPDYLIQEQCMQALTADLWPSRYQYVAGILESEFPKVYETLQTSGLIKFEIINLVNHCKNVFEQFGLSKDTEENRWLGYAIVGTIQSYLLSEGQ